MGGFTDPAFITALATLITALVGLLRVFQQSSTIKDTHATVKQVQKDTNGTVEALRAQLDHMRTTQATPEELAARRITSYDGGAPSGTAPTADPPTTT